MKILTIIPARCGSKGIENKNIIDVCGKPLIAYSIEQALLLKKNNLVDTVIVSTDCEKIASVSSQHGADVPFLRPKQIASDSSKSIDYYTHTIEFFENKGISFDAILLLQPTSPIRDYKTLLKAIEIFNNNNNNSLISVYKEEYISDLVMYNSINLNELTPLNKLHNLGVRRQDHGSVYVRNGAIYLTKISYVKKNKMIVSDFPLYIEMKKSDSINVDTMDDLIMLRKRCENLGN